MPQDKSNLKLTGSSKSSLATKNQYKRTSSGIKLLNHAIDAQLKKGR
jgi:hypothetical protein